MTDTKKKETAKPGEVVATNKEKRIIYVVHPVTPEAKKKLSGEGKIVDAKFYQA